MNKHSPGPWVADYDGEDSASITVTRPDLGTVLIADVWGVHGINDPAMSAEEAQHNVLLIQASPLLLAACEAMLATWGSQDEDAIIAARKLTIDAVAKAKVGAK